MALQAARGFGDLGTVWQEVGAAHSRPDLVAAGTELVKEVPGLTHDIAIAMKRSTVHMNGSIYGAAATGSPNPPCHPYVGTDLPCFLVQSPTLLSPRV